MNKDLLNRYLQAVKIWLPSKQQDDIIQELADNILSQAEDKEAELQRPLTNDEQLQLLKHFGHPVILAMRYSKGEYLIGPLMFRAYLTTIAISLALIIAGHLIASAVMIASGKPMGEAIGTFFRFFGAAIPMVGWMTIVFGLLDRCVAQSKFLENWNAKWDPSTLPPLRKQRTKTHGLATLIMAIIFNVWWLAGLQYPYLLMGPASAFLELGPMFYQLYPVLVLLGALTVMRTWTQTFRPQWVRFNIIARIVEQGGGLIVLAILIQDGRFLVASGGSQFYNRIADLANAGSVFGLRIALFIAAIVFLFESVRNIRKMMDDRPVPSGV